MTHSDCVAIIPAKGTSERIPRKNLAMCAGKSLLYRTIDCAVRTGIFTGIWLSSEDWDVRMAAHKINRTVWLLDRPNPYSAEGVSVAAVVSGVLGYVGYHLQGLPPSFCVLWPTSPLRTPEMLREMYSVFTSPDMGPFASLHSVNDFGEHEGTAIFMQTQEFLKRLSLDYHPPMPSWRVPESYICDVNTPEDLAEAERRLLAREGINV